jgi:demethylmenaquinone methyltransferase/2-methoxy-6-polyprenyl-1,4-benzoquinol methylase
MSQKTFFGFKEVDSADKAPLVRGVFERVAPKYDVMNDVMSMGVHRLWKDKLINMLNPRPNSRLLDVAGGTGDIAFRYLKKASGGHVTVADINPAMLREGYNNALNKNILHGMDWLCADAQALPLPDDTYDYYTIAFGIRNVTDISAALREAYRVLKPGGRFLCLEFSAVTNPLMAGLYEFYSFKVIPKMGKLVAGDEASYQYLVESIRKFPKQEEFLSMIGEAGFIRTSYTNLSSGAVAVHSGWKA